MKRHNLQPSLRESSDSLRQQAASTNLPMPSTPASGNGVYALALGAISSCDFGPVLDFDGPDCRCRYEHLSLSVPELGSALPELSGAQQPALRLSSSLDAVIADSPWWASVPVWTASERPSIPRNWLAPRCHARCRSAESWKRRPACWSDAPRVVLRAETAVGTGDSGCAPPLPVCPSPRQSRARHPRCCAPALAPPRLFEPRPPRRRSTWWDTGRALIPLQNKFWGISSALYACGECLHLLVRAR